MNLKKKIALIIAIATAICSLFCYDAFYSAPSRFSVRYENLSSIYIPEQMNDVRILFFSDLDYGTFMDSNRMNSLVNTINGLAPDVIIFGGDCFDQDAVITDDMASTVTTALRSLKAPLGKFAVLGDFDCKNDETRNCVISVLSNSDFEILDNSSILLRNKGSDSISIVGIGNQINGAQNINASYANISVSSYTIAVCHTPDTANSVPSDLTKYFLSGHSLGGQAYWFFGALYTPAGAEIYLRGKHVINDMFTLDITNGVGTTGTDIRMLSGAEVVLYRLNHKVLNDNTK